MNHNYDMIMIVIIIHVHGSGRDQEGKHLLSKDQLFSDSGSSDVPGSEAVAQVALDLRMG